MQKDDIPTHCREILDKWKKVSQTADILTGNSASCGEDMDVKLVRLLESQPRPTTVQRTYTEEERRIREAILAQYAEVFLLPHNTVTTVIVVYELRIVVYHYNESVNGRIFKVGGLKNERSQQHFCPFFLVLGVLIKQIIKW